ncbi:hypothetical protein [Streptacidiphilus sp. EB103A]|uniref:hypothetical protein n=1 Tax=Streptacidiphilus sp. EB103A TaxID=3156275 RepID=UPI0035173830
MPRLTRTLLTATTIGALALGAAACQSTPASHSDHPATGTHTASSQPAQRPVTSLPAATQAQLDAAAVTSDDVAALRMGVSPVDADNALIATGTVRAQPSNCQPLTDVWQGGAPEYTATASLERSVLEADATVTSTHTLHLAAYPGATALAFMNALTHAAATCSTYTQPDTEGEIHEVITPISSSLGDQSVAWYSSMTNGSKTFYATVTVVRVGSSVITAVELSDAVKSAEQLPPTNSSLLSEQINKLRSHTN